MLATLLFFQDDEDVPVPSPRPIEIYKYRNFLARTRPLGSATRAANLTDSIVVKKHVFHEVGGMRNSDPQSFHNEDSHLLLKLGCCSPCIVINNPATTAYRNHRTTDFGSVNTIAQGWIRLANSERHHEYPGKNSWARYALIGGRSLQWALRYCWQGGYIKLAIKLLVTNSPMIVVALIDKLAREFRQSARPILLE